MTNVRNISKVASSMNDRYAISLTEIKNFVRVDHDEDDEMLQDLCSAAVERLETYTRTSITQKQYAAEISDITSDKIILPLGPITSIDYVASKEGWKTYPLPSSYYHLDNDALILTSSSSSDLVIKYTAGKSTDDLTGSFRIAILEMILQMYELRGTPLSISDSDMEKWRNLCRYNITLT